MERLHRWSTRDSGKTECGSTKEEIALQEKGKNWYIAQPGALTVDPRRFSVCESGCFAEYQASEKIEHPAHYGGKDDPYEAIKVIRAWGLLKDFCLGNTIKYIARAGKKPGESALQDLKKSLWYLKTAIAEMEEIENGKK